MSRPLSPDEIYPAGVAGVVARFVALPTGVRLRIAESGPPSGWPVVCLHGWSASLYLFRHSLALLAERGFRVVAVDLRGHGLSDKPQARGSYSLDAHLADLDALLDALGFPRVTLVGQSMGGGLALHYALRHPPTPSAPGRVRGVVAINPSGLVPIRLLTAARVAPRSLVGAIGPRLMPRWLVRVVLEHLAYGDGSLVTERDVDEYWAPTQLPGFIAAARAALSEFEWRPLRPAEAGSLAVPSVVILGRQDRLVRNAERAARALANADVRMLAGGHCVNEELPEAVCAIIAEFCLKTS